MTTLITLLADHFHHISLLSLQFPMTPFFTMLHDSCHHNAQWLPNALSLRPKQESSMSSTKHSMYWLLPTYTDSFHILPPLLFHFSYTNVLSIPPKSHAISYYSVFSYVIFWKNFWSVAIISI